MLTVRFSELSIGPGTLFLDAGAGFGRHAFEAARLGAQVIALDYAQDEVIAMRATFSAMYEAGEIKAENLEGVLRGDATCLPFADNSFDCIVTSEVLEHIQNDVAALSELARVLKPGGTLGATVPSWFLRIHDVTLTKCRRQHFLECSSERWCRDDVPFQKLFVGVDKFIVLTRWANCTTQPPIRRMQSVCTVFVLNDQTSSAQFCLQLGTRVNTHVATLHKWCMVFIGQHPIDFFGKPRWHCCCKHATWFQNT